MQPTVLQGTTYNIVQGAQTASPTNPFVVAIKQNPWTLDPFDLTNMTALTAYFKNADGSILTLTQGSGLSVSGNPLLGKILITLTAAQTALLEVVQGSDLEILIGLSNADPVPVVIPNAYNVLQTQNSP